ncbi:NAD(P)/FAD-dependent oxidoreductase [Phenylobacterium montanum]|uniref:FAD-binding oxidoreductase n=1 Tax=Phenylobacterium montanum TaxID=2823693 RepID=A0A975FYT1_9CAUL|nr:FAD-binding oxidoreductase [Caulobacter sp. S6]QUD87775.1 FAD-binding oxidoreductase [Caulobacter sp. S6]
MSGQTDSAYVETFYRRGLPADASARPALQGTLEADVCIVGGGLAGLTAGLHLVRRGRSVVLLEANRVGWGASGRNGGFVSPGYSAGHDLIARRAGPETALALHRLSIEGVAIVEDNIRRLQPEGLDRTPGVMSTMRYDAAAALQSRRDWLAREFDYQVQFKPTEEVRSLLRSERYYQALYDPAAFHIDPLRYARAIACALEVEGGRVFEASPALVLEHDGAAPRVRTAGGEVRARDVLIASGGYTGHLVPALARSFLPIATYVMLTEPDPEAIGDAIRTRAGIGDNRRAGDYYRLVDGGRRILWGGKITTRTSEPRRLATLLHDTMASTYPQLKHLRVEIAWSGLMAYARHLMPQIGPLGPGLWSCTAFGGHGLNTTAIGGRVIAEAIAGDSDRHRLFAPFGLDWNGGPAGRAAVQATYWWLQANDFWRERGAGRDRSAG